MNKKTEHMLVAFFSGLFVGLILGITVKYPVQIDLINKYQFLCGTNHITEVKVGITGEIYSIKCDNGAEVQVHR
jgi:hypothetical protein